jgi:DNA/RNA endonuclease YhcR with UshA esterase domain
LHPTAITKPTLQTVSLNTLDIDDIGQKVTVIAQIVETASFSQGFKFTLKDGTGNIALLMWHDVYDDCWDAPQLNLGATVQATGIIGTYEGELQIEPHFGGDVKVNTPGRTKSPDTPINALPDSLGQRVTITGQVVRTEGTNSGAKIFVGDDTGETLVFIWNNVLARIPDNTGLGTAGTRVRVTGVVQEYRSNLEIVPILPYDVEVLR